MDLSLSGRRTIVTAAAQGIGAAVVAEYARAGAEVTAVDVNAARLAESCRGLPGVTPLAGDLTDAGFVRTIAESAAGFDVLVNVVGWVHHGTILDCDEDAWRRGVVVDGNDVLDVHRAARQAVARARAGDGPTFIECKTYRQCGHSRSDAGKYRPPGELESWIERDPIAQFRARLVAEGLLDESGASAVERRVKEDVRAAAARAADGPWPEVRPLHEATYAAPVPAREGAP